MKATLRSLVPSWAKRKYAEILRHRDSARRRSARDAAAALSAAKLDALLADLGVGAGDLVMVHSALGQFNNVEGGARAVLDVILARLGPEGTLVTPSFPHWLTVIRSNAAFNVQETRSDMGVLTELARLTPGAERSLHPTHPIVAIGAMARQLTERHHENAFAFSESSPFFRIAKADGKVLMIGVDLNSLTSFHIYEDLILPIAWHSIYDDMPRKFQLIDRDRNEIEYEGYFHSIHGARSRDVERMRLAFERHAALRRLRTDYSHIDVMTMRGVVVGCLKELLAGRSAYGAVQLAADEVDRVRRALALIE